MTAGSTQYPQGFVPNFSSIEASPGTNPGMQQAFSAAWGLGLQGLRPAGSSAELSMKWALPVSASQ